MKFDGFADSYNACNLKNNSLRPLNRIRLAEGWYTYKIKQFIAKRKSSSEILDFNPKMTEKYLEENFHQFQNDFVVDWSKKHALNCSSLNCHKTSKAFFYLIRIHRKKNTLRYYFCMGQNLKLKKVSDLCINFI